MTRFRQPKITARQEGGDDGYCYAIRVDGRLYIEGLTRSEVPYYKAQALARWKEKNPVAAATPACRCRKPTTHRDCMYCGSCWAGEVVCGVCRENGIDGKLIRGTGRVVCSYHKELSLRGKKGGAK